MKERPILFSAPMVRAILAGTKTQTRRVVKPQPPATVRDFCTYHNPKGDGPAHYAFDPVARELQDWFAVCPYGQPGDRLWVREAWARDDEDGTLMYRADVGRNACADAWEQGRIEGVPRYRWRPSIHMPRSASRITLEVSDIRVERLQDISEADAIAEGIEPAAAGHWRLYGPDTNGDMDRSPRVAYRSLWESINGPGSWEANPWVWVVEFKQVKGGAS